MHEIQYQKLAMGCALSSIVLLTLDAASVAGATYRVEIDYMGANAQGTHDHRPSQTVIDAVVQMFACQGHTLILDLDDEVPHETLLIGDPNADCGSFWSYTGATNTYRSYRNLYRDQGDGWHYCIFAHQYAKDADPDVPNSGCAATGSSGRANGGDAFIVTLGNFSGGTGSELQQATTLAHELGHNLGLSHCGDMNCGQTSPYVQNLPSIMSYTYQLGGVKNRLESLGFAPSYTLFKELDYSHGRMCTLDEVFLSEVRGTLMAQVDFNCDGVPDDDNVVQDLGFGGIQSGPSAPWCGEPNESLNILSDYDEWSNLNDGAALVHAANNGLLDATVELERRARLEEVCISFEEWEQIRRQYDLPRMVSLEVEACIHGENVYVGQDPALDSGTCAEPYETVQAAHASAPNHSVFYLIPDTYDEIGTTILDKPGVWTCNTGSATVR